MTTAAARPLALVEPGTAVSAVLFDRLLLGGLTFAGDDLTLPILNSVLLERRGRTLTAVSTDRYTLFREVLQVEEDEAEGPDWTFLLSVDDARTIRQLIACVSRGRTSSVKRLLTVQLTCTGDVLRVVVGSLRADFTTYDIAAYPKYQSLLPDDAADGTTPLDLGLAPRLLARIAVIDKQSYGGWRFRQMGRPNSPVVATPLSKDRDLLVLVMPVRIGTPGPAAATPGGGA